MVHAGRNAVGSAEIKYITRIMVMYFFYPYITIIRITRIPKIEFYC